MNPFSTIVSECLIMGRFLWFPFANQRTVPVDFRWLRIMVRSARTLLACYRRDARKFSSMAGGKVNRPRWSGCGTVLTQSHRVRRVARRGKGWRSGVLGVFFLWGDRNGRLLLRLLPHPPKLCETLGVLCGSAWESKCKQSSRKTGAYLKTTYDNKFYSLRVKPLVSPQETVGFSVGNRWFSCRKPMVSCKAPIRKPMAFGFFYSCSNVLERHTSQSHNCLCMEQSSIRFRW